MYKEKGHSFEGLYMKYWVKNSEILDSNRTEFDHKATLRTRDYILKVDFGHESLFFYPLHFSKLLCSVSLMMVLTALHRKYLHRRGRIHLHNTMVCVELSHSWMWNGDRK